MFEFLRCCVEARLNMFVSGGTGSGKTTTLNVLSSFIPEDERIVTIEDAAELQLRQEHVVTLEARPPNLEGLGEITTRDLLRNALHMRPDRIIVGECRGGEALDMIQAMSVGQEGSLSTGHANSSPDMLRRLETMILMSGYEMPLRTIREQIASAVDLIVHTARLKDGSRKIINITEVYGIEDDEILTQDIFEFQQTGVDGRGQDHRASSSRPASGPRSCPSSPPTASSSRPATSASRPRTPAHPVKVRVGKGRSVGIDQGAAAAGRLAVRARARGRQAGGMVYATGVGPVVPETLPTVRRLGQDAGGPVHGEPQDPARARGQFARQDRVGHLVPARPRRVRDVRDRVGEVVQGDPPAGQGTLMSPQHRRGGFRVSLGAIAQG